MCRAPSRQADRNRPPNKAGEMRLQADGDAANGNGVALKHRIGSANPLSCEGGGKNTDRGVVRAARGLSLAGV